MRGFGRNLEDSWTRHDELLDIERAADFLGWPVDLLHRAYENRQGPKAAIIDGEINYSLSVLEDFYDMGFSPDIAMYGYYNVPEEFQCYTKGDDGKWHYKGEW